MKVSIESIENVREFLIEWKSMLSKIKGNEYKFKPFTFMVDQSAANINSIATVYGEECQAENKTCQNGITFETLHIIQGSYQQKM